MTVTTAARPEGPDDPMLVVECWVPVRATATFDAGDLSTRLDEIGCPTAAEIAARADLGETLTGVDLAILTRAVEEHADRLDLPDQLDHDDTDTPTGWRVDLMARSDLMCCPAHDDKGRQP
jgi:hypothetical protein